MPAMCRPVCGQRAQIPQVHSLREQPVPSSRTGSRSGRSTRGQTAQGTLAHRPSHPWKGRLCVLAQVANVNAAAQGIAKKAVSGCEGARVASAAAGQLQLPGLVVCVRRARLGVFRLTTAGVQHQRAPQRPPSQSGLVEFHIESLSLEARKHAGRQAAQGGTAGKAHRICVELQQRLARCARRQLGTPTLASVGCEPRVRGKAPIQLRRTCL